MPLQASPLPPVVPSGWGGRHRKGLVSPVEVKEGELAGKTAAREKIASAVHVAVGVHQCRGVVRTPVASGYELAAVSSPANVIPQGDTQREQKGDCLCQSEPRWHQWIQPLGIGSWRAPWNGKPRVKGAFGEGWGCRASPAAVSMQPAAGECFHSEKQSSLSPQCPVLRVWLRTSALSTHAVNVPTMCHQRRSRHSQGLGSPSSC